MMLARTSICCLSALSAVLLAVLAGCQSTPSAQTAQPSQPAQTAQGSQTAPANTAAGPRRLQANAGTAPAPAPSKPSSTKAAAPASAPAADPTAQLMDPGAEVDGNATGGRVPASARAAAQRPTTDQATTPSGTLAGPATKARGAAKGTGDERPGWGVLLATFSSDDHRSLAETARNAIISKYPELRQAYVRSTSRGSVVLIGHFPNPQDPAAQAELKRVKDIGTGFPKPFARSMLSRIGATGDSGPPGPHDLRSVRAQRPKSTLYTLQVAVWSALGSNELKMPEIKRAAEAYAQQLRSQGYEAYYFHDFDTVTSTVTVGVFGADAYDSRSTLYAPEVEALMRKFPKSLVNGEEVLVPVDPKMPNAKTVPQGPRLVEIPKI